MEWKLCVSCANSTAVLCGCWLTMCIFDGVKCDVIRSSGFQLLRYRHFKCLRGLPVPIVEDRWDQSDSILLSGPILMSFIYVILVKQRRCLGLDVCRDCCLQTNTAVCPFQMKHHCFQHIWRHFWSCRYLFLRFLHLSFRYLNENPTAVAATCLCVKPTQSLNKFISATFHLNGF